MGMYYSRLSGEFRGVNCDHNNYGVANTSHGRAPRPCRPCRPGMTATDALPSSAAYLALDNSTPALGGFTSALACVTKAGHGYNGWYAPQCGQGLYNSGGNYQNCTQCPTGEARSRPMTFALFFWRLCCDSSSPVQHRFLAAGGSQQAASAGTAGCTCSSNTHHRVGLVFLLCHRPVHPQRCRQPSQH